MSVRLTVYVVIDVVSSVGQIWKISGDGSNCEEVQFYLMMRVAGVVDEDIDGEVVGIQVEIYADND